MFNDVSKGDKYELRITCTYCYSGGAICGMVKTKVRLSEVEQSVVIACQSGQAQLVKFFLDAGADKDMLMPDGSTLLHVAVEQGHHEVVAGIGTSRCRCK